MVRIVNVLFILFVLSLTGCVSIPTRNEEQALQAPPLTASEQLAEHSRTFTKGNWPDKEWWEMFDNEELSHCIQVALNENPTIKSARARVETARQVARKVRSKLFPLVFFDADANWQYLSKNGLYKTLNPNISRNGDLVDLSLSFDYEFDFWGKNRNLFRAALGEEKAEEAESEQVKLITTAAVAQAYFALKTNLVRKRLYERLYSTYASVYHLQEILERNALLSKLPVYVSGEGLEEVRKLLDSIRQETKANQHVLNVLMGYGPDEPTMMGVTILAPPKQLLVPENISMDLVARRPDLMASIWRAKAITFEVGAAAADFYPNINLKGLAGLESFHFSDLFQWASATTGLIPAIHLPIFTAGEIRANLESKRSEFDQAIYEYNGLLLQSLKEVANALVFADTMYKKRTSQEKILRLAHARNELTDMRVQSGLDSFMEAYMVKIKLIEKELDDALLLYNQYLAIIQLVKSLGGGYLSEYAVPIQAINNGTTTEPTK